MRGVLAKRLRKLSGYDPNNRTPIRNNVVGQKKIGYIDGTGKGNHRVEYIDVVQAVAGPRKRLYKLMKKHHKNAEMMEILIGLEEQITENEKQEQNKGENNE